MLNALKKDVTGLPSNDLFVKKILKLSSLLQNILEHLTDQESRDERLLKELLTLFGAESQKVIDIIVSNLKRLGGQKLSSLNEKKIAFAEHLEEFNTFLSSLQLQVSNHTFSEEVSAVSKPAKASIYCS